MMSILFRCKFGARLISRIGITCFSVYKLSNRMTSTNERVRYVGNPISSDNGLISQKLLQKLEFYYSLHVAMGVAY